MIMSLIILTVSRLPRLSNFSASSAKFHDNESHYLNYTHIFRVCQEKTRKMGINDIYAINYTHIFRVCQEKSKFFLQFSDFVRGAALYSSTSMSNSRPFNGCTGRLLRWIMAANAAICVSDISIGAVSTNQLTPSEHGGVVNEPS